MIGMFMSDENQVCFGESVVIGHIRVGVDINILILELKQKTAVAQEMNGELALRC